MFSELTIQSSGTITVLMATYNGEAYLKEQLESIALQNYPNWNLIISDDGSTDNTINIINSFITQNPNRAIQLHSGPRQGFVANFFHLLASAPSDSLYYAFSDQDDIFLPNKLSQAIDCLTETSPDRPALYCTPTIIINSQNVQTGVSAIPKKPLSFQNALVQNIASGNTMVINRAAYKLLLPSLTVRVPCHDWWFYLLITACGGQVFFNNLPAVRYRQHDKNTIGASKLMDQIIPIKGIKRLLTGKNREFNQENIIALKQFLPILSYQNKETLHYFEKARTSQTFLMRLYFFRRSKIYRQTWIGTLKLILAILLKKI